MPTINGGDEVQIGKDAETLGRNLRITVCANQGGRKYMEDRVHIQHVRPEDGSEEYTYVAVYDGHGGIHASEFVRRHLLKNIQKQEGFNKSDDEMLEAIRKGFIETHYSMWNVVDEWPLTASGYASTAGTTASVVFISRGRLFTGHVGDSAIILGKRKDLAEEVSGTSLTKDHKPDNTDEEERINKAGGMVMRKSGVMRVVWTRPLKGYSGPVCRTTPTESIAFLAVARSLGDLWSYNKDTKQFIVSPEPDVSCHKLDTKDLCLILGSDGLTNVLKPQQVVEIVNRCERETDPANNKLVNHSRIVLRHALQGWGNLRADNITVVTLLFDRLEENELHYGCYEHLSQHSPFAMDLDETFTDNQTALVRITPEYCQLLPTAPVEIVYTGALDHQFTSEVNYRGPGFLTQVVRDNPIVPPKGLSCLRRSASYSGKEGSEPYYCLIDFCSSWPASGDSSGRVLAKTAADPCSSQAKATSSSEEGFHSNSGPVVGREYGFAGAFCKKIRNDVEGKESPEVVPNDHAYASPTSKPVAVVPPFATTPVSSSRKLLIPFRRSRTSSFRRRGAARRNLIFNNETESHEDEDDAAAECKTSNQADVKENSFFEEGEPAEEAVPNEPKIAKPASVRRSFGGASALSPMLMLAALRTPDQLLLCKEANDPLRRELTTFRYSRYCSSVLSPPTLRLGQLRIGEASNAHRNKIPVEILGSAQKRKAELEGSAKVQSSEPPPKRSRIWGFFSSLIGDRKLK